MDPMEVDGDKPALSDGHPPPPPPQPPRRPSPAISPSAAPPAVATGKHPAPAPDPSTSSAASTTGAPGQVPSKRRRGIGIVTPNACTECRKKRAKCDGGTPCSRCAAQKGIDCHYELPVRQSKETLRNEIDHLRRQQRSSEQVLAALARPELGEEVVSRIRGGQSVEAISGWLEHAVQSTHSGGSGGTPSGPSGHSSTPVEGYSSVALQTVSPESSQRQSKFRQDGVQQSAWSGAPPSRGQTTPRSGSYPEVPNWGSVDTVRGPRSRVGSWVESTKGSSLPGPAQDTPPIAPGFPEMRVPPETWTSITSDGSLVQHLLSLYFCWEYPTFASLSKEHFLDDFSDGRPRFCSPILVNALLALGCRFSSRPSTRANPDNPYTAGDHFFKESQRLFYQEQDHHNLTTIQALGIMSIREASCGRDSESWYYAGQSVRLAIEMGLHRLQDDGHDDDESAVQAATFWGAFALDHAWSLATGSLPQCSCFPRLPPKPAIIDDIEASLWIPYTDDGKGISRLASAIEEKLNESKGVPLRRSYEQPSNVRSVYKCFCELSELVHQSLYILHSPGRPLTSKDLLAIYTQYLNWYDRIPEVLRLGVNFTPAVLFAHMYYHFAILLLFRPLIKLRLIGSLVTPRDVCSQAADAISSLLRSYSQLYTLRRTPSFVPYFVLTSSIMHLAIGATFPKVPPGAVDGEGVTPPVEPRVAEAIRSGIADLTEMAPCHFFAEQALNILRYLAKKWRIEVEVTSMDESEALHQGKGDFENLTRPVTSSLNFFAPNVSHADFNCTWAEARQSRGKQDSGEPDGVDLDQTAESLENPLFWPFPMQGRPMLPTGKELEEAGFALI